MKLLTFILCLSTLPSLASSDDSSPLQSVRVRTATKTQRKKNSACCNVNKVFKTVTLGAILGVSFLSGFMVAKHSVKPIIVKEPISRKECKCDPCPVYSDDEDYCGALWMTYRYRNLHEYEPY